MSTTSKIRAIGNSKGLILPKKYLDQCGIEDTVEITVKDKKITIEAARKSKKKKWSDFKKTNAREKTPFVSNAFDEKEWTW